MHWSADRPTNQLSNPTRNQQEEEPQQAAALAASKNAAQGRAAGSELSKDSSGTAGGPSSPSATATASASAALPDTDTPGHDPPMLRARQAMAAVGAGTAAGSSRGSRSTLLMSGPRRRLRLLTRHFASSGERWVDLGGGVRLARRTPTDPRLVPTGFVPPGGPEALPEVCSID